MDYDYKWQLHPFKVEKDRVRSHGYRVDGADPATFKALNSCWGADATRVFNHIHVERSADRATFRILNELYARDKSTLYYTSGKLKDADLESFRVLDKGCYLSDLGYFFEGYAQDKNGIWFYASTIGKPRILKKADAATFEVLSFGYARDAKNVFAGGFHIAKANPKTFELISQRYSRDDKRIYHGHLPVEGVDCATFEVIDSKNNRARDKNHLYEAGAQVEKFTDA